MEPGRLRNFDPRHIYRRGKRISEESVQQLRNLFDTASHLDVEHDILLLFGITRLAIESVSFPHTKGLQNQNYEIKAYSDNPVSLFIPV